MKNIINFIIITFSLLGVSFALENNTLNITSELDSSEKQLIEHEKELRKLIDSHWKQDKIFKHEDLSCCYCVYLNKDKKLHNIKLANVFCDTSNDSECAVFLKTAKQAIIDSFANRYNEIKNKLPSYPEHFHLCFGSKEGNLLFKNTK